MPSRQMLERNFFRALNSVVEPAVRRGFLSPRCAPVGLILLETVGYKSGQVRHTPLLATRVGGYTLVSTARGRQSFWVRNLQQQPDVRFHVGGRVKAASSYVFPAGSETTSGERLPGFVAAVEKASAALRARGWAFAVLQSGGR